MIKDRIKQLINDCNDRNFNKKEKTALCNHYFDHRHRLR